MGGTQESREIARAIARLKLPCLITVTTQAATHLYEPSPQQHILVGRLNPEDLQPFLLEQNIAAVVDASHPFAVEISQRAIAVTRDYNIPYLRYERPVSVIKQGDRAGGRGEVGTPLRSQADLGEAGGQHFDTLSDRGDEAVGAQCLRPKSQSLHPEPQIIELDSFTTLLQGNYLENQRTLLTVGCKILPRFQPWQNRATLFARVLPTVNSIDIALKAGFTPNRLIALRPPISPELEQALWQQWQISLVITKASGKAGGETLKRTLAQQLGISLIIIARPPVAYPQKTSDLNQVLTFCQQTLNPPK
ncbi:precorrin-6A/cobalt-precorrin-6A reductase [Lusitaniella coriacea LEGE 07157]|uniref:Precorrin-6A/cobalt-precorrin-6A reductase n=1 Tax=Lusitaniella coriacea LEGE 07157 TaxID=945747 RepID=A0A8J7AXT0_9CYAN|nr:precorrin-6A/cobalt-precorrin-6A reductase [Lusitaniella coriacea LEGE 07157]